MAKIKMYPDEKEYKKILNYSTGKGSTLSSPCHN